MWLCCCNNNSYCSWVLEWPIDRLYQFTYRESGSRPYSKQRLDLHFSSHNSKNGGLGCPKIKPDPLWTASPKCPLHLYRLLAWLQNEDRHLLTWTCMDVKPKRIMKARWTTYTNTDALCKNSVSLFSLRWMDLLLKWKMTVCYTIIIITMFYSVLVNTVHKSSLKVETLFVVPNLSTKSSSFCCNRAPIPLPLTIVFLQNYFPYKQSSPTVS